MHGVLRRLCRECGGDSICVHGRVRTDCPHCLLPQAKRAKTRAAEEVEVEVEAEIKTEAETEAEIHDEIVKKSQELANTNNWEMDLGEDEDQDAILAEALEEDQRWSSSHGLPIAFISFQAT